MIDFKKDPDDEFKVCTANDECPLEDGHDGTHAKWGQTKDSIWVWRDKRPVYHFDLKPGTKFTREDVGVCVAYLEFMKEVRHSPDTSDS